MNIDWFTFAAQIVNFLILIWILQRFLYRPIQKVMEERRNRIRSQVEESDKKLQEASLREEEIRKHEKEMEREREELLARSREEARHQKQTLLEEARADVEKQRTLWFEDLEKERSAFLGELKRRSAQQIHSILRRALTDLADEELEERMAAAFIDKLRSMDSDVRDSILRSREMEEVIIGIASARPLPEKLRKRIQKAVHDEISLEAQVRFEEDPHLISGIQMTVAGHEISWTLDRYLTTLEENLSAALERGGNESQ